MSLSALVLSLAAALLFVAGGAFMKMSNGFAQLLPGAIALGLFLGGAVIQTLAMRHAEMGTSYVSILALEVVLAFAFGACFFHERVSLLKLLGVALIIGGFALLHVGTSARAR